MSDKKDNKLDKKEDSSNTVSQDRESKKALRRAALNNPGPLHLDEKHKKAGIHHRVVNDTPGNIKRYEQMGYYLVQDDIKVGAGHINEPSKMGSTVTVEVGRQKSQKGVLMAIDKEDKEILDELRQERINLVDESLSKTGIPSEFQTGGINLGK